MSRGGRAGGAGRGGAGGEAGRGAGSGPARGLRHLEVPGPGRGGGEGPGVWMKLPLKEDPGEQLLDVLKRQLRVGVLDRPLEHQ